MSARRSGPGLGTGAASNNLDRVGTHSQSTEAPRTPHLSAEEIAASLPLYVLVVKGTTGRITRRVYLSLHSAIKATQRAQARGSAATLEMMRAVPHQVGRELHGTAGGEEVAGHDR